MVHLTKEKCKKMQWLPIAMGIPLKLKGLMVLLPVIHLPLTEEPQDLQGYVKLPSGLN